MPSLLELLDQMKILFIDDNSFVLETFQFMFQDSTAQVHLTLSGKEALEIVKNEKFDTIVCDIEMPEINGFKFGEIFRQHDTITPIIFFSGRVLDHELESKLQNIKNNVFVGSKNFEKLHALILKMEPAI